MQYKWTVLLNTTLGGLMAAIDMNILMISMPTIFRGLGINPLGNGEFTVLLWLLMGYSIVMATFLITFGRLSDIYGRTRLYTIGFTIFTIGAILLSIIPDGSGNTGAYLLIGLRMFQAIGGGFLMVNSAALLTDAFPSNELGKALGINQISFIAGSFIGLILGGVLAAYNWHLVFIVTVPFAVAGSAWSYFKLHEIAKRVKVPMDLAGNVTIGLSLVLMMVGITYTFVPYNGSSMGWGNPWVWTSIISGLILMFVFIYIETKVKYPLFRLDLFKIRPFSFGNISGFMASMGRGAIMFLVIIWLQGIWLPLHGYSYEDAPLWAGIYMLPMTVGLVIFGPIGGVLTDKYGARVLATVGMIITALSFFLLTLLPYDFNLPIFLVILFINGTGAGLFIAPNMAAIMNSLPKKDRGVGSGIRATFMNIGQTISMAIFFSIAISVFSTHLPDSIHNLKGQSPAIINLLLHIPPSGMLFAALMGINPLAGIVPPGSPLMSNSFFPTLIGPSFMIGLQIALYVGIVLSIVGAVFSAMRGKHYIHESNVDDDDEKSSAKPSEDDEEQDDDEDEKEEEPEPPKPKVKTKKKRDK